MKKYICSLVILVCLCLIRSANAQQTIFNVPSTDVLERGKVYFELDATFKPSNQELAGRFSSFVPRVVAGIGSNIEVGFNLLGNSQPDSDATTFSPSIKWRVYQGKTNGVIVVIGNNLLIPVRNKSYNIGNYTYAQASKTFKRTKSRLTTGGYYFTKNVVSSVARAGGQFGFEQPINSKFGIAADWYTGKHSAGYLTTGANFKALPKVTGYLGYSIGNSNARNGNHFFYAALGININ